MSNLLAHRSNFALQQSGVLLYLKTARLPKNRSDDDFDPRAFRTTSKPIKPWMAYFSLIRSCFGAGMLAIPQAISHTGIIMGPIMTICIGFLVVHGHYTLIWCLNEISKQLRIPYTPYRHGFRIALQYGPLKCLKTVVKYSDYILDVFMFCSQLGICCVFVIFTTDSLRDMMDWSSSQPAQAILFIPYLIMDIFIKDLKIISIVSMLGNVMNFIGMIIVIYFMFVDPHAIEINYFSTNVIHFFFGFGLMMYNLSATTVILSLERALENPYNLTKRFGIIDLGIWIPTVIAAIFGPLAYWSFGMMEDNVLRSLPYDDDLAMVAIGLYFIAIALNFPMQSKPAIEIMMRFQFSEEILYSRDQHSLSLTLSETINRTGFVFVCFLLCYLFPVQGPFLASVGCITSPCIVFVFPALMELSLLYNNHHTESYGKHKIYLIKDIILICFGILFSLLGWILCYHLITVRTMFIKLNI